ncbi:MAG: sigma 54-interacting transcriptional regulator [Myxococcota bacterium]
MKLEDLASQELTEFCGMMTTSALMREFFATLERVSRTDAPVLIRGESGTGKELAAHAIHRLGGRRDAPFHAVNCATFSPELLSSELFGHVKGAFTGAVGNRPGLFKLADHGTVFLDEIAEIPLSVQAQLLRVVEHQTFVPVGGSEPVSVNVRIVSATHRALRNEVRIGSFRQDLMYRVRVVPLYLPALRDRGDDMLALARNFIERNNERGLRRIDRVQPATVDALRMYPWPGNIRELQNVVEYAFAVGEGPVLTLEDLTPELRGEAPDEGPGVDLIAMESGERRRILEALDQTRGKKAEAAARLIPSR